MGMPISLVGRQNHMQALSALGIAPETPSFPAVVACPLCHQNTLHVFDDLVTNGLWMHCESCARHGNIITFGAQIWNTSLSDAMARFVDLELATPSEEARLAGDYSQLELRQKAGHDFWQQAADQLWNHGDDVLACRLQELGVVREVVGAGGFVGVATQSQIAELCEAVQRGKPSVLRHNSPSLVFPYQDLPGRFTGFLLFQYDEDFAYRRSFIPMAPTRKTDAGYFLLRAALQPPVEPFKNRMFIADDPFWVLTAQMQQLKYGLPLLPLAASYHGPETSSYGTNWYSFPPAPRFFHSSSAIPAVISQACAAKGYVSILPLDGPAYRKRNPQYYTWRLGKINKAAETWQTNLANTLGGMSEIAAFSFASKLTIQHDKLARFFERSGGMFSAEFPARVLDNIRLAPSEPTRAFKRWILLERDNKLWTQTGHQICNVLPVITKVIQADDGQKLYAGYVIMGAERFEFVDTAAKIERMGFLAFVATTLAPFGKLVTFNKQWNSRSLLLSMQLHPPVIESVSSKVGWDETINQFRFGSYALSSAGDVILTSTLPNSRTKFKFPEPGVLAPLSLRQFLTPSPQNAFVWSVFAAIVTSLVEPVLRRDPTATAIVGPAFGIATKIGAALNCQHKQTPAIDRRAVATFLVNSVKNTDWPVFVSNAFNDGLFSLAVSHCHNRAALVRMSEDCAAVATGYGWNTITGTAPGAETTFSDLQYVLPTYIQRLLKMRMTLAATHKHAIVGVLHDLHAWLEEVYGATFHLQKALNGLATPSDAHVTLMQELNRAICAGKIDVIPRPRRRDQPSNYVLRQKEHWWLNRRAVDNYMNNHKNIPPNWLAVIDLMATAGVFAGDEVVQKLPGIRVAAEWCDQFWDNGTSSFKRETG